MPNKKASTEHGHFTKNGFFRPGTIPRAIPKKYDPPVGCHIRATDGAKNVVLLLEERLPGSTSERLEMVNGLEWIDVILKGRSISSNGWDPSVMKDPERVAEQLYRAAVISCHTSFEAQEAVADKNLRAWHDNRETADERPAAEPEGEPGDLMTDAIEVSGSHAVHDGGSEG